MTALKKQKLEEECTLSSVSGIDLLKSSMQSFEAFKGLISDVSVSKFAGVLGKGENGEVFSYAIKGKEFAIKIANHVEDWVDFWDNDGEVLLARAESVINSFLCEKFGHCFPHICGIYGFATGCYNVEKNLICRETFTASSVIVMERYTASLNEEFYTLTEAQLFSVTMQILLTAALLESLGVSHNDVSVSNVLLKRGDINEVFEYRLPNGSKIAIATFGITAVLCDFGVASQANWFNRSDGFGDPRARHDSISHYYSATASKKKNSFRVMRNRPKGMMMITENPLKMHYHPLQFSCFTGLERDIAGFANYLLFKHLSIPESRETRQTFAKFLRAILCSVPRQGGFAFAEGVYMTLRHGHFGDSARLVCANNVVTKTFALPSTEKLELYRLILACNLGDRSVVQKDKFEVTSWEPGLDDSSSSGRGQ